MVLYAIRKWGWREVLRQWWQHSWFRGGELVGTDRAGNRYYTVRDPRYFQHGKDRYVEYGEVGEGNARPDAAMVPPHWHGWLHHTHDEVPREDDAQACPWMRDVYTENMTGTDQAYKARPSVPPQIRGFGPKVPPLPGEKCSGQ